MSKYSNYLFKFDLLILSLLKGKNMYEYEITKQIKQMTKGTIISDKDGEQYLYKITQNCDNLVKYIHLIVHGGSYERY